MGGLEHYIKALKEMVFLPLVYPELFERFHLSPPRGVLFYGPPGQSFCLLLLYVLCCSPTMNCRPSCKIELYPFRFWSLFCLSCLCQDLTLLDNSCNYMAEVLHLACVECLCSHCRSPLQCCRPANNRSMTACKVFCIQPGFDPD